MATVETGSTPESAKDRIVEIGMADAVIGVVDIKSADDLRIAIENTQDGIAAIGRPIRAVLAYRTPSSTSELPAPDISTGDGALQLVPFSLPQLDPSVALSQIITESLYAVMGISSKLGARATAVLTSGFQTITSQWVRHLLEPILERDFDLVAPIYAYRRNEGLLNHAILAPMNSTLFGKELQNPFGPDFGLSGRLVSQLLLKGQHKVGVTGALSAYAVTTEAISRNLLICEAYLGPRVQPVIDGKDLSSIVAQVIGLAFAETERLAPLWQRIRGVEGVPIFGQPLASADGTSQPDITRLYDSFQLGFRNLQEIWSLVLPPASVFEWRKIGRASPDQFFIPDVLWVRSIYDFALAYRMRTLNRDHLLRALTPLYLGWIASHSLEIDGSEFTAVERRIKHLASTFEAEKPYLVSRWRWPDRFNP